MPGRAGPGGMGARGPAVTRSPVGREESRDERRREHIANPTIAEAITAPRAPSDGRFGGSLSLDSSGGSDGLVAAIRRDRTRFIDRGTPPACGETAREIRQQTRGQGGVAAGAAPKSARHVVAPRRSGPKRLDRREAVRKLTSERGSRSGSPHVAPRRETGGCDQPPVEASEASVVEASVVGASVVEASELTSGEVSGVASRPASVPASGGGSVPSS